MLNSNLTASDDLKFRFATDGEGNYGYLGADDSFIPFKSGVEPATITFKTISTIRTDTYPIDYNFRLPNIGYTKAKTISLSVSNVYGYSTVKTNPKSNISGLTTIGQEVDISEYAEICLRGATGADNNQNILTEWVIDLY